MVSERRVLGVLAFGPTREKRAFADEELAVTHALAAEGALALERVRSASALGEALERERLLARISRRVRSELDVQALMEAAVAETGKALGAERCLILRERGGGVAAGWQVGSGAGAVPPELVTSLEGLLGRRRTAVLPDVEGSLVAAPIGVFDSVLGVLAVRRGGHSVWSDEELALVEAVAREVGVALHTARLLGENERRLREQRGFYKVATALGQPLSFERTVEALGEAATDALGGSFSAVLLPESGRLELVGAQRLAKRLARVVGAGLEAGGAGVLAAAARERRPFTSARVERDERFETAWRSAARGVYASLLAVPVDDPRSGDAGLVLVFFEEERAFADEDLDLAAHLAEAARGALERSQLFETERSSRSLAQQLARTGTILASELDPAAVLDEVVRQAPLLVRADASAIHVLEEDELVVAAAEGEAASDLVGISSPASAGLCGEIVQSRAPRQIEDASLDDRARAADPLLAAGNAAFVGVPLFGSEGALRGVLALYAAQPRAWRSEEVEALLALATNASAALANAELYQRVAVEKERNDAILANIADGIVAVDREGAVVLWNAAAERITGIAGSEAIGREPAELLQRQLASETGAPAGDRLVSIRRGGRELWLSLTEAVMRDPAGEIAGRVFAFRDISADLLVEQMKSDFVSTISHELRTPLTSIYGFAETLLRRDELFTPAERSTFIGYIASESERLTKIVDALLNVARLDTGDLQVQLAPTELEPVLAEAVRSQEEALGDNGHSFVLDLPSARLAAQVDREKLRQILANLLDNAVRYSPQGGTVTVAARRRSDVVELRVSDQGVGVPVSEQERIFRKFYRGPGGNGGGTGLGLFIARGLVAAMGGRIWVESAEGEGASFIFELPLAGAVAALEE
jgi:PAS domain S-box-containing protein